MELKKFIEQIPDFHTLIPSKQIPYLSYFLQIEMNMEVVNPKDIRECCKTLHINCHSNVPAFFNNSSRRGNNQIFVKKKGGYNLLAIHRESIGNVLVKKEIQVEASDDLFPLSIFEPTKDYLKDFAKESAACYDYGLYSSCLFMLRKITEILIIELYESKNLETKIKNGNNDYLQLSELIKAASNESSWKFSKIVKENLPKIKLLADSSVHSKRFKARKPDIETMKTEVRISFEEIIKLIDYPAWNARK